MIVETNPTGNATVTPATPIIANATVNIPIATRAKNSNIIKAGAISEYVVRTLYTTNRDAKVYFAISTPYFAMYDLYVSLYTIIDAIDQATIS